MSCEGGIRIRASLPLAVQILALVGGALAIAQLVTIGLTLLLPPPPLSHYSLKDIADALKGEKVSVPGATPLIRRILPEPPSYRSQGWIVSPQARADLAEMVGATPDDVRLLFYFPPPAGGVFPTLPPRLKPASFTTLEGAEGDLGGQVVPVQFAPRGPPVGPMFGGFGAAGPNGQGLPQGDAGAGLGPGRGPDAAAGGLPGGPGAMPVPGGRWGPAARPALPAAHAIPPWRQWARRAWPGGTASRAFGPARDLPGLPTRPSMTFPGLTALMANPGAQARVNGAGAGGPSEPSTVRTPAPGASGEAEPETSLQGAFTGSPEPEPKAPAPASSPSHRSAGVTGSAFDQSGLLAPAPLVAQKTGDGSGWIVGAAPPGVRATKAPPFVPGDFIAAVRLGPSRWATVQPRPEAFPNRWQRRVFLWFATAMLLIAPLAWLFARRLTGPLAAFAAAAEALGRDPTAVGANLTGPAEVGRAARAFNEMQARLKRFVDDRTTMLGAISHDLRTPLARMRFRLERAPPELRRGMLHDVQQMEDMLNSVLAFIRDASEPAARKRVDLRSIIECAVEDAEMVGGDVVLKPGPPVSVEVDPLAIRRVAANLIDNALKYGNRAEVGLFTNGREVAVTVADNGPGLLPEEIERVFAPFYRSDVARSMNQGGIGLGLPVSRSIARSHGGDVRLSNRPGGLLAELTLPLAPTQPPLATPYLRPFFASAGDVGDADGPADASRLKES